MALSDLLIDSRNPIDKVVGYDTGSFSITSGNTATPSFAHGLSYAPLYYIKWSTDPSFVVSYDQTGFVGMSDYSLAAQSDATNIYLFGLNLSLSTVTLYYRILYFMPSDVNVAADQTQSGLDDFILNSEYNYTKLIISGKTASQNETINHNLGFYPQVEVWYERVSDSRIIYNTGNLPDGTWVPVASITTSQLILSDSTGTAARWHYRIYGDEV